MRLVLRNASSVVTCSAAGRRIKRGAEMSDVGVLKNADIYIEDGIIKEIGSVADKGDCETVDASGQMILPGFVDPHTHAIFAGTREREFAMRARGMSYSQIAAAGGGIIDTVLKTRETPKSKLRSQAARRIDAMLGRGTTTLEIKTGYGLDFKNELKLLEAANELKEESLADIVVTFLGAHAIPPEYRADREDYIRIITDELLPYVSKKKLASFCDIFCDEGFFTISESERILRVALEAGLGVKLHADELSANGGVSLAVELGAVSVDHLENISHDEITSLSMSDTVGIVLPSVAAYLRTKPAPAREMIDRGCAVALATDLNPGTSMVDNMQTIMFLGISQCGMTVEEALNASTINAAAAIGLAERLGSIEVGKQADLLIVDAEDFSYLPYHFTGNRITNVVKNGTVLEFS